LRGADFGGTELVIHRCAIYGDTLSMYTRICPICKNIITFTNKQNCKKAEGKRCQSCARKEIYSQPPTHQKICICCGKEELHRYYKKTYSIDWKCQKCKHLIKQECVICNSIYEKNKNSKGVTCCTKCTLIKSARTLAGNDNITNISQIESIKRKKKEKGFWFTDKNLSGLNNPMYGKKQRESTKQIIRTKRLERLKTQLGQLIPAYNSNGCKAIDEYGKTHGYNFQHAENGGEYHIKELGYWVDGYDKSQNVVIEYDEKWHKRRIHKDAERQKEITEYLNCSFIRIGPLHD
jgi:hypothetical protein